MNLAASIGVLGHHKPPSGGERSGDEADVRQAAGGEKFFGAGGNGYERREDAEGSSFPVLHIICSPSVFFAGRDRPKVAL